MSDEDLLPEENRAISSLIREELAKRRMTRAGLADKAKISLSTLEKALAGQRPFTLATVVRLEDALGHALRRNGAAKSQEASLAPDSLGSYSRPAVKWLEGNYLTLRPSFSVAKGIYAYRTEISWDNTLAHLIFQESERLDTAYKQDGAVSVPHQSGYIYLVTNKHGQHRMATLSRPMIGGEMFGLLATLQSGKGAALIPIAVPIVLCPIRIFGEATRFGLIKPDEDIYAAYEKLLRRCISEPFVILQSE
ncbi:MAG: helix-turn-helix transcriptional regulator [Phyllobacteriaceae bacterium]|jgi:transcriptional regulator with XRE-family HTH domain|nr:helix-turn-helix transcriptional regulator [Phyllobacteriaceae bacterium]